MAIAVLMGCQGEGGDSVSGSPPAAGMGDVGGEGGAGGVGGGASGTGGGQPIDAGIAGHGGTGGEPLDAGGAGEGGAGGEVAPDASEVDAAEPMLTDASTLDDYNGMCATARWSNVSPECWSCWCERCSDTLNAATRRSFEIFECMFDERLVVDDFLELLCEVRAAEQECVDGSTQDWDKLVAFDTCLIGMPTDTEFRACDTVCRTPYADDVCTRYP
jgi:hypothetical protein